MAEDCPLTVDRITMFDWLAKWFQRTPPGEGEAPLPKTSEARAPGSARGAAAAAKVQPSPASGSRAWAQTEQHPVPESAWATTVQMDDWGDDDAPGAARDESERRSLALLQARGLSALQYVAETAARICETPMAAVSMMDGESVWFQAVVGTELQQLPRRASFCDWAVSNMPDTLVVHDALEDPRFNRLALVRGEPHIRFYAGAPFMAAASVSLGAVSVADTVPRELTPVQLRTLELLARQTVMLLDARMRNEEAPAA